MIKRVEIQNIYGIKEKQILNFEASELKPNQVTYDSGVVSSNNKKKILLSPTFISQNASGKTSILKAINFIGKINNINELLEEIWPFDKEKVKQIDEELLRNLSILALTFEKASSITRIKSILKHRLPWIIDRISMHNFRKSFLGKLDPNSNDFSDIFQKQINEFRIESDKYAMTSLNEKLESLSMIKNGLKLNLVKTYSNKKNIVINVYYEDMEKKILITNSFVQYNNKIIKFDDELLKRENYIKNYNGEGFALLYLYEQIILETDDAPKNIDEFWDITTNKFKLFMTFDNNKLDKNKKYSKYRYLRPIPNSKKWLIRKINKTSISKKENYKNSTTFIDDTKIKNDILNLGHSFIDLIVQTTSNNIVNKILKSIDPNHIGIAKFGDTYLAKNIDNDLISTSELSFGTLKVLYIIWKFYLVSKYKNSVILIDEIENGLNMSLIRFIYKIFYSPEINQNNTQLIATTHSPSIFEEKACGLQNAFIVVKENNKFIFERAKDTKFIDRTEDLISMFKTKNYYNDHYWLSKNKGHNLYTSNTLSIEKLFWLLDELEEQS